MRLINSSVRGVLATDMLRTSTLSAPYLSAMKQLSRKQQRARERQFFLREDLLMAKYDLAQRWKDKAIAEKEAHQALALMLQEMTKPKMVKRRRSSHRKARGNAVNDYPLTQFAGRQVLVRFVESTAGVPETQVFASCAI
ncbi:hypothetical protein LJR189_004650 [Acidovorax delafieldii]|jgi:hypothetical protein|uniref:hypothetical protein n=1 Tax=Acidovorax delafieldii TaxID=47920 RepID=UPI003ED0BBB0